MALPTLEHQIQFVDTILHVKASRQGGEKYRYVILEVLKSRYTPPLAGELIDIDLSIFELLGYPITNDQHIIIFLAVKKNSYDCIDFLPVLNDKVLYGKDDPSVLKELTLPELRKIIEHHS